MNLKYILPIAAAVFAGLTAMAADTFVSFSGDGFMLNADGDVAIYVNPDSPKGVMAAAEALGRDLTDVCACNVAFVDSPADADIKIATVPDGKWEQYVIDSTGGKVDITGSDRRGTIYGIYELSRQIGVSPWSWWADVPVTKHDTIYILPGKFSDGEPSVKYRGVFINDEDWGLKPWSSLNYEKDLNDIGPRTYERVAELLLRLKGNMLAPAMHSCTGAFYTHPESKYVVDSLGIIITTSHCEPLLLNNACKLEWDSKVDGEWNYATNKETIRGKWENRLAETSHLDNIYTTAMRGVHDEGLRGNLSIDERTRLLEEVISDQREMLSRHTGKPATEVPQIFVPYKETMDVYENGLNVPDDITIVWVDDNYGYMKRVSSPEEQKRSGGAGVYYHLSYLGAPHDYLWLNTTSPALMYEELMKAYHCGADRYWLLNVGDIKPMELGVTTFLDLAWNVDGSSYDSVNAHQPQMLAEIFGDSLRTDFDYIMNVQYRLAWSHKPEFMGGEYEWDDQEHTGLHDTDYSFNDGEAQQRLLDYQKIADMAENIYASLPKEYKAAFFQLVGYPVQAASQVNRKFLMSKLNHQLADKGRFAEANWAAEQCQIAHDSIDALTAIYNGLLDGKWRHMMNIPTGWCALYQNMPELTLTEDVTATPVNLTALISTPYNKGINLAEYADKSAEINIIEGLGCDWQAVQLGEPWSQAADAVISYTTGPTSSDTLALEVAFLPFFPIYHGVDNRFGVSVDGGEMQVVSNHFKEYSREWKDQVMINSKSATLSFPVDSSLSSHTVTIHAIDPGQIVQSIKVIP